jgi:hypothetical protein
VFDRIHRVALVRPDRDACRFQQGCRRHVTAHLRALPAAMLKRGFHLKRASTTPMIKGLAGRAGTALRGSAK